MIYRNQFKTTVNQDGFTIIELLIATIVFSVILLITTFAVIQISRTYIRGYISTETQNTDQAIIDQITQAVQQSASTISLVSYNSGVYWFCINNTEFTYQYNYTLGVTATPPNEDVFIEAPTSNCKNPLNLATPPKGSRELLGQHMQLIQTSSNGDIIVQATNSALLYNVNISILYGDPYTYINPAKYVYGCKPLTLGGDFCAISTVTSTVEQRTGLGAPVY